jgi:hypothetical protein
VEGKAQTEAEATKVKNDASQIYVSREFRGKGSMFTIHLLSQKMHGSVKNLL